LEPGLDPARDLHAVPISAAVAIEIARWGRLASVTARATHAGVLDSSIVACGFWVPAGRFLVGLRAGATARSRMRAALRAAFARATPSLDLGVSRSGITRIFGAASRASSKDQRQRGSANKKARRHCRGNPANRVREHLLFATGEIA